MSSTVATDPIQRFKAHVERYISLHSCYGVDAFGRREFVPRDALSRFWNQEDRDEIVNVLCRTREQERIQGDRQKISDDYLVVFSILVSISRPEYIGAFMSTETPLDDVHLPIRNIPEEWTYNAELKAVFEEFHKKQWRFCPLTFNRRPWRLKLSAYTIVPISNQRRIGQYADKTEDSEDQEDDVLVYEADWHQSCRGTLLESSRVVLKVYHMRTQAVTDSLNNEIDVYSNLKESAFDHIIGYFGSFEQHGKLTIILEHARGGNLVGFWEQNALPATLQDRIELWDSFFHLLNALEATHNLNPVAGTVKDTGQWWLKGTHQDIRPQNILITATEGNSFNITFKLTDFGTGHVRRCRNQGMDPMASQRRGNGMYSPPESVRDNNTSRLQHCESDIWFLGAVASEFLVWSVKGNEFRIKYQEERRKATDQTPLKGGYHDGCFHDGECRLDVVDQAHQSTLDSIDEDDLITPVVSKIILDHMLVANVADRSNASKTYAAWRAELQAVLSSVHVPLRPRKTTGTRDSYVGSILSSPQAFNPSGNPWLADSMSSEPAQHYGPDRLHHPNPRHVQFGDWRGAGVAGPSNFHHGFGPGPGRGSIRRGTSDSSGLGNAFEPIPEGAIGETTTGSVGVPFSPPLRPAGHGISRSGTLASNASWRKSFSPPSMLSRRETVDEHYGVAGPDEEGSSSRTHNGLNIDDNPRATSSLPSPPETPTPPRVKRGLSKGGASTSFGKSFATTLRAPTIITETEKITIDTVFDRIVSSEKEKSNIWALPGRKKKPDLLAEFPRLGEAVRKLKGLKGREQIFIIDDAVSMSTHRHEMARTVRVIGRLLKEGQVDPDREFTVYHTCDLGATVQLSNATALQEHVARLKFSSGPCSFGAQLDEITTEILKSESPVSIYVLTDGRWNALPENPQELCGVDAVIRRILVANKNLSRQSNHVGFQFIRFYRANPDDDEGKERLDYLDNSLPRQFDQLRIPKSDIIDTTDWDDDVCKMLLGGVYTDED